MIERKIVMNDDIELTYVNESKVIMSDDAVV